MYDSITITVKICRVDELLTAALIKFGEKLNYSHICFDEANTRYSSGNFSKQFDSAIAPIRKAYRKFLDEKRKVA